MPVVQTISVIRSKAWLNKMLAALKTRPAAALFATAKLRLLKDRVLSLSENTTKADLEAHEADYTDYPAGGATVTPPDPVNYNVLGQGWAAGEVFNITTSPVVTGNDIAGYWVDDGTDPVVMEYFPQGADVSMQAPGDWLELDYGDCLYFVQPT